MHHITSYTAPPVDKFAVYHGPWTNLIDSTGATGEFSQDQIIPYKYEAFLKRVETQLTPTRIKVEYKWTDGKLSLAPARIEYVPLQFVDVTIGNETPIAIVREEPMGEDVLVWGPQDMSVPPGLTSTEDVYWRNDLFKCYRPLQVPMFPCGLFYFKQAHAHRREDLSK